MLDRRGCGRTDGKSWRRRGIGVGAERRRGRLQATRLQIWARDRWRNGRRPRRRGGWRLRAIFGFEARDRLVKRRVFVGDIASGIGGWIERNWPISALRARS